MRKIGGIKMSTAIRLTDNSKKNKKNERYCSVQESFEQSLKEIKLIEEGKIQPKPWRELMKELKALEE